MIRRIQRQAKVLPSSTKARCWYPYGRSTSLPDVCLDLACHIWKTYMSCTRVFGKLHTSQLPIWKGDTTYYIIYTISSLNIEYRFWFQTKTPSDIIEKERQQGARTSSAPSPHRSTSFRANLSLGWPWAKTRTSSFLLFMWKNDHGSTYTYIYIGCLIVSYLQSVQLTYIGKQRKASWGQQVKHPWVVIQVNRSTTQVRLRYDRCSFERPGKQWASKQWPWKRLWKSKGFHGFVQVTFRRDFDTSPAPENSSRKSRFLDKCEKDAMELCEISMNNTLPALIIDSKRDPKTTWHQIYINLNLVLGDRLLKPKLHTMGQHCIPQCQKHHQDKHRWGPMLKKLFYHHDPARYRQTNEPRYILYFYTEPKNLTSDDQCYHCYISLSSEQKWKA